MACVSIRSRNTAQAPANTQQIGIAWFNDLIELKSLWEAKDKIGQLTLVPTAFIDALAFVPALVGALVIAIGDQQWAHRKSGYYYYNGYSTTPTYLNVNFQGPSDADRKICFALCAAVA